MSSKVFESCARAVVGAREMRGSYHKTCEVWVYLGGMLAPPHDVEGGSEHEIDLQGLCSCPIVQGEAQQTRREMK